MTKDKKHSIGWLLLNILIMVAVSIILIVITFRWMQSYTRHGQYITVPDVSGMYEEEAGQALAAAGLRYEVSDYKFDKSMVEGGVIEQNPKAGAYVKQERKVSDHAEHSVCNHHKNENESETDSSGLDGKLQSVGSDSSCLY